MDECRLYSTKINPV